MKTSTLPRIAFLVCSLGLSSVIVASAQDADTSTNAAPTDGTPGFQHHHGGGVLTKDEWQELKKDREQVLASDPDLAAQEKALHEQMKALQDKIDDAIEQNDPNAAAIITKLKAAHPHHFNPDGNSNSTPSTDTSNQ